jgi:hypothetical protein
MKTHTTIGIMAVATLVAGCCTTHTKYPIGAAYGHEQEFRKLLEVSLPVRDKIEEREKIEAIRFNYDFKKALVIYETPVIGRGEAVFEDDGFGRYHGQMSCMDQDKTTGHTVIVSKPIIITFPD